ncbi:hypothetical protein D3C81_2210550 [compost metagenome]
MRLPCATHTHEECIEIIHFGEGPINLFTPRGLPDQDWIEVRQVHIRSGVLSLDLSVVKLHSLHTL